MLGIYNIHDLNMSEIFPLDKLPFKEEKVGKHPRHALHLGGILFVYISIASLEPLIIELMHITYSDKVTVERCHAIKCLIHVLNFVGVPFENFAIKEEEAPLSMMYLLELKHKHPSSMQEVAAA